MTPAQRAGVVARVFLRSTAPDNAVMAALMGITFLGHSTVLIEVGGVRILTDPVLFDRVSLLRRVGSPLDPGLHADIDIVLLSHLHLDHFDVPSLRLLGSPSSRSDRTSKWSRWRWLTRTMSMSA